MDLTKFKQQMKDAVNNNTLLTPKHDPNNIHVPYQAFRSVLSLEASASLTAFINSEDYSVHEYENTNLANTPYYMKIIPNSGSSFSLAASGIPANSTIESSDLDSLIVVSGSSQGWHIFGEDDSVIANKLNNRVLIDKGSLT